MVHHDIDPSLDGVKVLSLLLVGIGTMRMQTHIRLELHGRLVVMTGAEEVTLGAAWTPGAGAA